MTKLAFYSRPLRVSSSPTDPIAEKTPTGCLLLEGTFKRSRPALRGAHSEVTSSQVMYLVTENVVDVALISEGLQDGPHKSLQLIWGAGLGCGVELARPKAPNTRVSER